MSIAHESWIDILVQSGLRAYVAPMFRSARWYTRNGHVVEYDWNEQAGIKAMEQALALIDRAEAHPCNRLTGMLVPAQIDTCTPELLQASHAEARRRGIGWQTHAAQSLPEFHEITRRHGLTPIQWLHSLGVLDSRSLVGHAIFVDDHPNTHWSTETDLAILAETGASVAHCPTVFMRRGMALRDFGRYLRAGVNMSIGTDTYPHNMIEEMRHVGYLVLVDMTHHLMRPSRDPVRSLVYAAADRAVHTVYVDGRRVVHEGRVDSLDYHAAAEQVDAAQRRAEKLVPSRDLVAGRTAQQMSPLSFEYV